MTLGASNLIRWVTRHRWISLIVVLLLAGGTLQVPRLVASFERNARRPKLAAISSVHVHKVTARPPMHNRHEGRLLTTLPKAAWPKAGSADLSLAAAPVTPGAARSSGLAKAVTARAGGLPVWATPATQPTGSSQPRVQKADGIPTPVGKIRIDVLDSAYARRAGLNGVLVKVRRADGATSPGPVTVGVNYSAFRYAFGGDWASRLRLVLLPSCVLSTPTVPACQAGVPLATTNDVRSGQLSSPIEVASDGSAMLGTNSTAQNPASSPAASASPSASVRSPQPRPTASTPSATPGGGRTPARASVTPSPSPTPTAKPSSGATSGSVLALAAAPAGSSGSYSATSLSASSTWQVDAHTGDFTWSYPIRVPSVPGGLAPKVALSYDSGSVDGRTRTTNNQPSWIGEGFDYAPGYVERSYAACADAGVPKHTVSGKSVQDGDQCWKGDNLTLSLNGKSSELIKDDKTGAWHLRDDDGSKVERLTGAANGALNGEYWKLTTTDGTQYTFGLNHLPGYGSGASATNSTWTVPVYGPKAGDPCYDADLTKASCTQAWRWNLDYLVNRRGNAVSYDYAAETNYYKRGYAMADGATGTSTVYTRGGYLKEIDYGQHTDANGSIYSTHAMARVNFGTIERCDTTSSFNCDTASNFTKSNASHWPDVPVDQNCSSTDACTTNISPSYWSRKRLSTITTQVWNGTAWSDAESWGMDQEFPAISDLDSPELWLKGITHKGLANGGKISLPEVTFARAPLPNRVLNADGSPSDNLPELYKYRVIGVTTETGSTISVVYSGRDCVWGQTPDPANDTKRCFQQYWTPPGASDPSPDWFNKYVVTDVNTSDLTGGAPTVDTHYVYADNEAAWHYDESPITPDKHKSWSDWRGYSSVQVITGASGGTQSETDTTYMRGMDGDRAKRDGSTTKPAQVKDSEGVALTDAEPLSGFTREQITRNGPGGPEISGTIADPTQLTPTATQGSRSAYMVQVAAVHKRIALASGGYRRTQTDTTYDAYGNPTQINQRDLSAGGDHQCTRISYLNDTADWMVAYPTRTLSLSVDCAATPTYPDDVIGDKQVGYDAAGGATSTGIAVSYSGSTPTFLTTASTTYDSYGQVTQVKDAAGHTTKTSYTPTTGIPTQITVTNTLGQATTRVLDLVTGLPLTVYDANNDPKNTNSYRTDSTYDALGRLTAVWLPGQSKAAGKPASQKFSYLVRPNGATAVASMSLNNDGSTYLTSYSLYDGLLRPRQTQSPAPGGGRVISDTLYDSRGLAVETRPHYFNSSSPGTDLVSADDATIPAQSYTTYDGAGRVTASAYAELGVEQWRTTTAYGGDRTTVTPPPGGTVTTTVVDARGRTTDLLQYHDRDAPSVADDTHYSYTPTGQLASITDATGHNTWSYEHDLRGRLISSTTPDSGTAKGTYNDLDQLTSITDARGKTTSFGYDPLGRRTAVYDGPDTTSPVLSSWVYDTLAKGQLTSATRHTPQGDYTTKVDAYDPEYRPTSTSITVPSVTGEEKLASTYTFTANYNPDGTTANTTFPAVGDLPYELMRYSYNSTRQPTDTSGLSSYVLGTDYTAFAEPQQYTLATTGQWTWLTNYYEQGTRRLAEQTVQRQASTTTDRDAHYGYDQVGNVTSAADTPGTGQTDVQCYRYDYLQRLTQAWTTATAPTGSLPDPCASAPTAGSTITGPAPYWQSYGYDLTGNRTTETDHDTTGNTGADITHPYTYPNAGKPQPHAVTSVTASGGLQPDRTDSFTYDADGNATTRNVAGTQQTLTWDNQNELAQISDTKNGTTGYVYDATGTLIERREPNATTLYLPGEQIQLDKKTGTLAATRYYTHGGQTIAVRTSAGVQWLAPDAQGTADLQIDAASQDVTQRRFTPYGQSRGTSSPWIGDRGYVGGVQEPSTGLTQLGARHYDPDTGSFISADPVLNPANPQQINGYSYAENNPTTSSDPTGLCDPEMGCATNPCHPTGGICGHEGEVLGIGPCGCIGTSPRGPTPTTITYGPRVISAPNLELIVAAMIRVGHQAEFRNILDRMDTCGPDSQTEGSCGGFLTMEKAAFAIAVCHQSGISCTGNQNPIGYAAGVNPWLVLAIGREGGGAPRDEGVPIPEDTSSQAGVRNPERPTPEGEAAPADIDRVSAGSENRTVYRGDQRSPSTIADAGGFQSKGGTTDLKLYVSSKTPSTFVSTSKKLSVAKNFTMTEKNTNGYVYRIESAPGGVDVNKTLGLPWMLMNAFPGEREVAFEGRIDSQFISGYRQYRGGSPVGDWMPFPPEGD